MKRKHILITKPQLENIIKECMIKIIKEYTEFEGKCDINTHWRYEKPLIEKYGLGMYRHMCMLKEQKILYEGLIKSYEYEILCDRIVELGGEIINIDNSNTTLRIYTNIPSNSEDDFQHLLLQCGWYVLSQIGDITIVTPKFGTDANDLVYNQYNGILYHTTPICNEISILGQGLIPKSGKKIDNSQDLVHFFFSKEDCFAMAPSLCSSNKPQQKRYTLFKIDLSKLYKGNVKPNFFHDPQHPDGIVTKENIPPYCITKICDYEVDL
ncbi:MAG: hypothetical protein MJY63_03310 [Paludibacteraceae bacterium]|nr:hypothetical protein [Paludibacteraceae bacterium]